MIHDDMGCIEVRLRMAGLGWCSNDSITNMGWGLDKMGYSIWFERYDWHGQRTLVLRGSKACYHAHTSDLDQIVHATRKAARIALMAWEEFPDCFPSQGVGGELVEQKPLSC